MLQHKIYFILRTYALKFYDKKFMYVITKYIKITYFGKFQLLTSRDGHDF